MGNRALVGRLEKKCHDYQLQRWTWEEPNGSISPRSSHLKLHFLARSQHHLSFDELSPAQDQEVVLTSNPYVLDVATRRAQLAAKRLIDISGALIGLALLCVPFLLVALAIKCTSKGPVFFHQHRVGYRNARFEIVKFRTMYANACDKSGISQTTVEDFRVTPMGKILRRTSVDELPQLWNVLRGEMSLVGPRPHVDGMIAAGMPYDMLISMYHDRHAMRPGITGLAQAEGYRGPTTEIKAAVGRIELDLRYIQSFSLWLDIKIIVRTVINELFRGTGD